VTANNKLLGACAGYGIELEYIIADRDTLGVLPIADQLLGQAAGGYVADVDRGHLGWSNKLVLHLLEIKNAAPDAGRGLPERDRAHRRTARPPDAHCHAPVDGPRHGKSALAPRRCDRLPDLRPYMAADCIGIELQINQRIALAAAAAGGGCGCS
jgi:hypothetical protein